MKITLIIYTEGGFFPQLFILKYFKPKEKLKNGTMNNHILFT